LSKKLALLALLLPILLMTFIATPVQATQEIIDSDYEEGEKLKVSAVMYKNTGEIDPNWDYYAVKCTIEDIYAKNDYWKGPLYADVWLYFSPSAEEVPSNHEPKAGWSWSQAMVTFSYQGIGFRVNLPAYGVSYEAKHEGGYFKVHWSFCGVSGIAFDFVFRDYAETAVGVRVPQGYKPYCWASGWAAWYVNYFYLVFVYDSQEWVGWCYVDPPGAANLLAPTVPSFPDVRRLIQGRRRRK